jgi:CRP-like cAMP-binding protein/GAF domain-containing protein
MRVAPASPPLSPRSQRLKEAFSADALYSKARYRALEALLDDAIVILLLFSAVVTPFHTCFYDSNAATFQILIKLAQLPLQIILGIKLGVMGVRLKKSNGAIVFSNLFNGPGILVLAVSSVPPLQFAPRNTVTGVFLSLKILMYVVVSFPKAQELRSPSLRVLAYFLLLHVVVLNQTGFLYAILQQEYGDLGCGQLTQTRGFLYDGELFCYDYGRRVGTVFVWALGLLLSLGYAQWQVQPSELLWSYTTMVLGFFTGALVIAEVVDVIQATSRNRRTFLDQAQMLEDFGKINRINPALRHKIRRAYSVYFEHSGGVHEAEVMDIVDRASSGLRKQLQRELCTSCLESELTLSCPINGAGTDDTNSQQQQQQQQLFRDGRDDSTSPVGEQGGLSKGGHHQHRAHVQPRVYFSPKTVDIISASCRWCVVSDGEAVFRAGDVGDCVYIVASGCVEVVAGGRDAATKILLRRTSSSLLRRRPVEEARRKIQARRSRSLRAVATDGRGVSKGGLVGGANDGGDGAGDGRVLGTHGAGFVFGEVSLIFPALRSCTVRSVTDTKLLCFGQETLKRLENESPHDYTKLMRTAEACKKRYRPAEPLIDEKSTRQNESAAVREADKINAAFKTSDAMQMITRDTTAELQEETGVTMSWFSLVTESEQVLHECSGGPGEAINGMAVPKAEGVCHYTVRDYCDDGTGTLVVPDIKSDPRFKDKGFHAPGALVPEGLNFYSGGAVFVNGKAVGSLCVMDKEANAGGKWTRETQLALEQKAERLGLMLEAELEGEAKPKMQVIIAD